MPVDDQFYLDKKEPQKGCLLAMRDCLLRSDVPISETVRYGMPCFRYKGKIFCYLWMDKKTEEPYFLFVEGKHLNHPKLETGSRARMKIFRVDPNSDLPISDCNALLNQALKLYKNGTVKIETRRR